MVCSCESTKGRVLIFQTANENTFGSFSPLCLDTLETRIHCNGSQLSITLQVASLPKKQLWNGGQRINLTLMNKKSSASSWWHSD